MILYITLLTLGIGSLFGCIGDLKPIQVFDSTCSESFYGINPGAVEYLNNLLANPSIALRHDSKHGIVFKVQNTSKIYKIVRSNRGLDISDKVDLRVGRIFTSAGYGLEPLDIVYYEDPKGNNMQLSGNDNTRVVCINEEDAAKDPKSEGHKFKTHFIRIRYDKAKNEIKRDEIDIKDLAKELKAKFNEEAASIAKALGFKFEDLADLGLNGAIKDVILDETTKDKIKMALKRAKSTEEGDRKIEIPANSQIGHVLFMKVDKGAYILIRFVDGNMPILASYEIISGKENVYLTD